MDILRFVLRFVVIAVIYFIIIYAIKLMYTDTKVVEKKKKQVRRAVNALEVIANGDNSNLRKGSIIPIGDILTLGRKADNSIVMDDKYVSSHHLKIYIRNNRYIIEDLESTNGTKINDARIENTAVLNVGDVIKVGTAVFKMI